MHVIKSYNVHICVLIILLKNPSQVIEPLYTLSPHLLPPELWADPVQPYASHSCLIYLFVDLATMHQKPIKYPVSEKNQTNRYMEKSQPADLSIMAQILTSTGICWDGFK